jgi:transporter family-2 protein
LPSAGGIGAMPWLAPLGCRDRVFCGYRRLLFVDKVGAGVFAGLKITTNILMSLAIVHFVAGTFAKWQSFVGEKPKRIKHTGL